MATLIGTLAARGRTRALAFAGLLLLLWLLPGCSRQDAVDDGLPDDTGVTPTEIRIGSSLALSGHAQYLGIQTLRGAQAYLRHVDANGGIHGRGIRLITYDDAYDPSRCLVNTQRLIIEDQVFALFNYVGTPTTVKILPLVEQAHIPLVGMFTGARVLREPFNPLLVNVRASYYQETAAAVRHLVQDLGLSRIAVFYQYDSFGFDGLTGTELALKELGLTPVARGSYVRGTLAVEEGLRRIVAARPQAVILVGAYEPCAAFITEARRGGFDPVFHSVSFGGAEELARRLAGEEGAVILMSQVLPPLDSGAARGVAEEYETLLRAYFPAEVPSIVGLEGFLNARVLVEALRRAGPHLTRQGLVEAVGSIHDLPLAMDNATGPQELRLSFGSQDHQGLDAVYMTRLEHGRFELVTDWPALRRELDARPQAPREPGP